MRIAALYDIHGNLPALDAVLAEIQEVGADLIVVGGDVVPGPMAVECLERLMALDTPTRFIPGNGENDILEISQGRTPARVPAPFLDSMKWVADRIPPDMMDAISKWPATTRADVMGLGNVVFCHATPRDDNEIFTRLTPDERVEPVLKGAGGDVVVCGHTHMQFDRTVGTVRVVNAGSVGMPFGEPGAYWVLIGPGIELRRTAYDLEAAAERFKTSEYPLPDLIDPRNPPAEAQMLETFEAAALR